MPANPPDDPSELITFTHFRATDGRRLGKSFSIGPDGSIKKESHALFRSGIASKVTLQGGLSSLPQYLDALEATDCIATGVLSEPEVQIVPKGSERQTDSARPVRHRTKEAMRQPVPSLVMFDYDPSANMPAAVRCSSASELMKKISDAIPIFRGVPWVGRGSSSQGIFNEKTGQSYARAGGIHVYVATNIADLNALRKNLEVALWRAGLGYIEFARNGRRLPRTIIDLSVLSPERLIFEAAPLLGTGVGRNPPIWESSDD